MNKERLFVPGLPDEEFLRAAGVPMTKNEIRVLALAKLRLFPGAVVYDVGAGSGSISIEAKLLFPSAQVFAVERDPQALQLLTANQERFGVDLQVVEGAAPTALHPLPSADRIFIGGSGGSLAEIIELCDRKLVPGGWMVINAISLKNTAKAFEALENRGYEVEAVQVNIAVSSQKAAAIMWQARNPVTIISGKKGDGSNAQR
ncbi:MAG: precorrin-6Y C5,15-methyltransferase (decarboxylating) subunit CbiT [Syntrophomonadaceae bacterium]|nr:precorrin-6Y C5,15-methyltransferase (decarboxylating) subunit CbiT [Syntrophomonadaceae bacterium]